MYTLNNVIEGRYEFTLRARSSQGPSSPPSRITIAAETPSSKSSNLVATLPRGGVFNKPINIGASAITAPSSYRFTAESGISVIYSEVEPRVTPGTYWHDGTNVYLWDGVDWNAVYQVLEPFTLSASGTVAS